MYYFNVSLDVPFNIADSFEAWDLGFQLLLQLHSHGRLPAGTTAAAAAIAATAAELSEAFTNKALQHGTSSSSSSSRIVNVSSSNYGRRDATAVVADDAKCSVGKKRDVEGNQGNSRSSSVGLGIGGQGAFVGSGTAAGTALSSAVPSADGGVAAVQRQCKEGAARASVIICGRSSQIGGLTEQSQSGGQDIAANAATASKPGGSRNSISGLDAAALLQLGQTHGQHNGMLSHQSVDRVGSFDHGVAVAKGAVDRPNSGSSMTGSVRGGGRWGGAGAHLDRSSSSMSSRMSYDLEGLDNAGGGGTEGGRGGGFGAGAGGVALEGLKLEDLQECRVVAVLQAWKELREQLHR